MVKYPDTKEVEFIIAVGNPAKVISRDYLHRVLEMQRRMSKMNRTLIIAEAGVNHNGDIELAKQLIVAAKECGADIVKFQTGLPHNVTSKYAKQAEYQKINTAKEESQLEMLKDLALQYSDFVILQEYANKIGIRFLSTPFDIESIQFLATIDMDYWKIPSGEITNLPYLEEVVKYKKDVILSTGMSTLNEIGDAVDILHRGGIENITLLQCTTEYPTPYNEVNLNVLATLRKEFGLPVGLSDHTQGIEVAIAAVAMGAEVIEKHFTLDRNMPGPDHKASLEPAELRDMIQSIRHVEDAKGTGIKEVQKSERGNMEVARKSIVAKCDIKRGEVFTKENLTTKRPGNGVSPMRWHEILGTKAIRDFLEDELIEV